MLDINTPRSNGFDPFDALRRRFATVPITIVTSSRARSDKLQAKMRGANYVEKPSDLASFITSIGGAIKKMLNDA